MAFEDEIMDNISDDEFEEALKQADENGFSEEDIMEPGAEEIGQEQEPEKPKITKEEEEATVGAVVDFAGALLVKFKHIRTPEARQQWLNEYHSLVDPFLMMIGFGRALREMPVSQMSPTTTVALGIGILVVMAFLVAKPPEPDIPPRVNPAPKGEVVNANKPKNNSKNEEKTEEKNTAKVG